MNKLVYERLCANEPAQSIDVFQYAGGAIMLSASRSTTLTPEDAMDLGTALVNAAFPFMRTGRAPHSGRPQVDVREVVVRHRVGESGACDCPMCVAAVTARG